MKIIITTLLGLFYLPSAFANDGKTVIKELTPSYAFSKPGLYEVISPYTGNVIYVFREQVIPPFLVMVCSRQFVFVS
jgi:hypothetical protein